MNARPDTRPRVAILGPARIGVVLDALRDAITWHRTTTRNTDAAADYEAVWQELRAAPETGVAEIHGPDGLVLECLTMICVDGLPQAVLDGSQCAVPNCGKNFKNILAGTVWQVLGVTPDGREIRACSDHRPEDVLGPVA